MNHIPSSSSKTHARRFAVVFMCTSVLSLMLSYVAFGPGRSMSLLSFSPLTSEAPYGQTGQTASVAQGILLAQAPAPAAAAAPAVAPAGDSSTPPGIGAPATPAGAAPSAPSTPPGAGPASTPAGSGTDAPTPTNPSTQTPAPTRNQPSTQDNRQAGVLKNPIGTKNGTLGELLDMLLSTLLMIGSIVIVCAIILAGFKYITAQGDTKQIEAAHQQLFWTAIGAAILLGARIIAKVIENTVRALSS
jgi:hypothetical protein